LVAVLATVYAGIGLFSQGGAGPYLFSTLHGHEVEIYGRGVYRDDSAFRVPLLRGTDAVTLFICVPALVIAGLLYRRGSLRGHLCLTSILAYFLYNAASMALGVAYNELLLVYIAATSAALFAFILAFSSVDLSRLAAHTSEGLPRRWIALFLVVVGLSALVWLPDIVGALIQGGVPAHLAHYHTEVTYTLDLGIVLPTACLASFLVWRRRPLGTLLASVTITFMLVVGMVVTSQSMMQALAGIRLTREEFATYIAPFVILSLVALALLRSILRNTTTRASA
jgi:prepilin signal peptidase PulO-like enzyme (type II secretory pathway)